MKFGYLTASAVLALAALTANQASAQTVTGTVNVHGSVAARCGTDAAGSTTASGAINLGELTGTNGALLPALVGSTRNSPAGVVDLNVGCSSTRFNVTMSASRLTNPAAVVVAPMSANVDYTAEAKITMAGGGFTYATYTTAATLPAATVTLVNGSTSATIGNFEVRVYGLHAENGDSTAMLAGSYDSVISFQVAPAL
jgi:hypothetical protein